MAHHELDDMDALLAELQALERRERDVSDYRRRLHARLDSFPNELTARKEREVSAERKELHRRIDELRGRLRPVIGTPQPPPPRLGA